MDKTRVDGRISVGNRTLVEGDATTRVEVNGNISSVDVLNDSIIGGKQYTEVKVSRDKVPEKINKGWLAKIIAKLFGKKYSEPSREDNSDKKPKKTKKNQWRREDGTLYETYNPSNISIAANDRKTVITISKDTYDKTR